jgi:hypothetical protein
VNAYSDFNTIPHDALPVTFGPNATGSGGLCNTPNNAGGGTDPSKIYDGGPTVWIVQDYFSNRKTIMMLLAANTGVMQNNQDLKDRAKQWIKMYVAYGTTTDSSPAELNRWKDAFPGLGWGYAMSVGAYGEIADVLARNGDPSAYNFTTTATLTGGSTCPISNSTMKSVQSVATTMLKYLDHTILRYIPGHAGSSNYAIDADDEVANEHRVHDTYITKSNLFYNSTYIKGVYTRIGSGTPAYPASPVTSSASAWTGPSGIFPGVLFMSGQLEGIVNPYGTSASPTPTPSATPSQKFAIGDRFQANANVTVHSNPAYLTTNVVGSQPQGAQGTIVGGPTLGTDNAWWWQVDYDTGADGWNGESVLTKIASATPPGPAACSLYTPSTTIPTGYASPYDVVSSPNTNLMNATCDITSARLDLGKGDPLQYIYNQGYLFKTGGSAWTPLSYTSIESSIAGAWYPKTATANISLTQTELANPNYNLAYICSWVGSAWKCGCRDASCTQSYWQIQSFKR